MTSVTTDGLAEFTCGFLTAALEKIPLKRTAIEINDVGTVTTMTLASGAKVIVAVSVDKTVAS